MLKGLALTPPVIGRISIGRMVLKNDRRLPEKDDSFTVTSQVQNMEGWVLHPVDELLRKDPDAKLQTIPVRLLFDDPDLTLRASYTLFERSTGRPLCVGDGVSCKRVSPEGMQSLPCPSPQSCAVGIAGHCKPYGRLHVRIDVEVSVVDELGSFVFRTTGFNSIRTLSARLRYLHAATGGVLASLPLELRLRGKSTTMSHGTPIYYVDLTTRPGTSLTQAVALARKEREQQFALGFNQAALDEAARQGLALGEFEESEEEGVDVVQEFYPDEGDGFSTGSRPENAPAPPTPDAQSSPPALSARKTPLVSKLRRKLEDAGVAGFSGRADGGPTSPASGNGHG
ncbi:MAG: phage capsid protein [Burkholderiales bacterium RIFCSPHIGHO2_12_FULL_65_48]|nr:MAG: phage capsid protein [Burkholderiales bacterium RIFCSPHIGHO2_02_FULL_64_19]OGB22347.1 MAG: phage capsid protein [Burkholderiales bacterium RIFCSPHIGHO2_12_FULL_65_48]OGB53408.1 MAG: phage capsid protein [Burkholderiales bacterium RIFCSPLOWO2_12_FULL_64_33]